jgi:flagellar protein FlgJ
MMIPEAPPVATQGDRQQQAKLVDGAQQFEAMLLGEMLKPLQFGEAAGADQADDSTGGANDTLRSMGIEALTRSLAKGNGFGIAQRIVRQVNAQHELDERNRGSTKVP